MTSGYSRALACVFVLGTVGWIFDSDEIVNGGGNTHRFEAKCFKAVLETAPPPQGTVIFLQ